MTDPEGETLTVEYFLGQAVKFLKVSADGVLSLDIPANQTLDSKSSYDIKIDMKDPKGAQTLVTLPILIGDKPCILERLEPSFVPHINLPGGPLAIVIEPFSFKVREEKECFTKQVYSV